MSVMRLTASSPEINVVGAVQPASDGDCTQEVSAGRNVRLLPRHRNADGFLRRHLVVDGFGRLGDCDLHALDSAVEGVVAWPVVFGYGCAGVLADVAAIVGGEDHRQRGGDLPVADVIAVGVQGDLAALAQAAAGVGEL